jgi:capsular polysaccharide biosynthesis protein
MKNKSLIIIVSFLAVIICLILTELLFYAVTPTFLIILSFTIGIITGVCIAALIRSLTNIIRTKRLKNQQTQL